MSLNKVMLIGNLGKDPELKTFDSGSSVCNFSIATTKKFKGKDGLMKEETEWHRICVFGKIADSCAKYLRKGKKVYVEGSHRTRSWEDSDGNKKYSTEVVAHNVQFLSPLESQQQAPQQNSGYMSDPY